MTSKKITITCSDGFNLSAKLYQPDGAVKSGVMIAPATGIKSGFYNSFATFLAENGYGVITFDNRGIGRSRMEDINHGNPSLINWGRLDMTAIMEALKINFPDTDYHIVGHSAGGQLLGLMDNWKDVKSLFNFAASSGSLKNMSYPFKMKATFFLNVFIPVSNFLFKQANSQWMGMGEPLPKEVAKQWSKWCNGSGYVKTDFGVAIKEHAFDELTLPSLWLHATDDGIANYKNVVEMSHVYSNAKVEIVTLDNKELGFKELGHMRFFSSRCKSLWPMAIEWLEKN